MIHIQTFKEALKSVSVRKDLFCLSYTINKSLSLILFSLAYLFIFCTGVGSGLGSLYPPVPPLVITRSACSSCISLMILATFSVTVIPYSACIYKIIQYNTCMISVHVHVIHVYIKLHVNYIIL